MDFVAIADAHLADALLDAETVLSDAQTSHATHCNDSPDAP